jgi:uncharacterized protein with putative carbohydrate binding module
MTFRLLGMTEEDRLDFEQATGIKTEGARLIVEASVQETERMLAEAIREVQEVIGPHGAISRLQAGSLRIAPGLGIGVFEDGILKTTISAAGDIYAGSDISDPSTTTFCVYVNEQDYNGEAMNAGDILIGDNTTGKANVKYDAHEGQLQFRFGATVNVYMDTDGTLKAGAGAVTLSAAGILLQADAYPGGAYITWKTAAGEQIGDIIADYSAASLSGIALSGRAKSSAEIGNAALQAQNESGTTKSVIAVDARGIATVNLEDGTVDTLGAQKMQIKTNTSDTDEINEILILQTLSKGTVAKGLGTALAFWIEDSGGSAVKAGRVAAEWVDKTNGADQSDLKIGYKVKGTLYERIYSRPDFYRQASVVDDFFLLGVVTGGSALGAGSAALVTGTPTHLGIARITQSGANTGYRFFPSTSLITYLGGGESVEIIFQAQSTSNTVFRLGFQDGVTTTAPNNGAWVNVAGTTLSGKTAANGTTSTTGTTYTISATTWYRMRVFVSDNAGTVYFELYTCSDGALVWSDSLTTNIPTVAGREVLVGALFYKTTAGTVDLADIDWLSYYGSKALVR